MNRMLAESHHKRERALNSDSTASMECPQCESAINRDNHYCANCGVELVVCYGCKSPNIGLAQFCHACGQPMIRSPDLDEVTEIATREARRFDVLGQAALAIVKLQEIIESIERLELVHQIERSHTVSISGERCSNGRWR